MATILEIPYLGVISAILAILVGILILIFPRILNYVIAIYLILIGLFALIAGVSY